MNTNNLDNNTATPLYLQLKNKLQEDIENGRLAPGSKIPTEFELGEQYGVSRVTVRKALKELSDQGYLERKSGKGTFVAEKKLQRSLSSGVFAFSEMCRSMGLTPGAQTIKIALEDPTEKDTERMHLTPYEALNATTMNTACAMGVSKEYGSITVGKVANFYITKPIPSLDFIPYAYTTPIIKRVFLRGEEL